MSIDYTKISHKIKIAKRIQETEDTVSLVLEIPPTLKDKYKYKAGQFVTFFMQINGETISRSYSLASSPDADTNFKVAVKLVPGGKGSTYLTQKVKEGEELYTTPPAGFFCLPKDFADHKIAFFAAGSGITPAISLIKSVLKKSNTACSLYYQNRSESSIIFKNELSAIEKEYVTRFSVAHILSKPSSSWSGLKGRANSENIKEFLKRTGFTEKSLYFICGPDGFMNTVRGTLDELKIDDLNVHFESFGSGVSHSSTTSAQSPKDSAAQAKLPVAKSIPAIDGGDTWIGEKAEHSDPEEIEVLLDGETQSVKPKKGSTILETLLEAGLNPPYSCMDGACMACMAKIESGLVYQTEPGILSDENIENKECLTCQARPGSKKVKVNYSVF